MCLHLLFFCWTFYQQWKKMTYELKCGKKIVNEFHTFNFSCNLFLSNVWSILLVIFSSCNLWYALAINAIIFTKIIRSNYANLVNKNSQVLVFLFLCKWIQKVKSPMVDFVNLWPHLSYYLQIFLIGEDTNMSYLLHRVVNQSL